MASPLVLLLAAGLLRLASSAALSWLSTLRDRSRRRSLEALARTAGPGATVVDRCADGGLLAVWTCDPDRVHHQVGGAR